jgi:hypothetical protein
LFVNCTVLARGSLVPAQATAAWLRFQLCGHNPAFFFVLVCRAA